MVEICISYQLNQKMTDKFLRLSSQKELDGLVSELRAAGEKFSNEVIAIQEEFRTRADNTISNNVVRIDRHKRGSHGGDSC